MFNQISIFHGTILKAKVEDARVTKEEVVAEEISGVAKEDIPSTYTCNFTPTCNSNVEQGFKY